MTLYEIKQWIEDLDITLSGLPELDSVGGCSILVTGATGLIGSAVIDLLLRYNDTHATPIRILAAGRNPEKMACRFGRQAERKEFLTVRYDALKTDLDLGVCADFIIHGASNAFPAMIVKEPVETMLSNVVGLKVLLDYARQTNAKRLLFISSSEVYGRKNSGEPFSEDDYGYIDPLDARSSYSIGKRTAETLCVSYSKEYGTESIIVRPGHIYGPTASPHDNRVSSAWAYSAARGEDIIMKSAGTQIRSYCYCLDCASAILKVMLNGENNCAYNISNPDSVITIRQLAGFLAAYSGTSVRMEQPTSAEKQGFNPMQNSSLNANRLLALGWKGMFSAGTGLEHTVRILRELGSDGYSRR